MDCAATWTVVGETPRGASNGLWEAFRPPPNPEVEFLIGAGRVARQIRQSFPRRNL